MFKPVEQHWGLKLRKTPCGGGFGFSGTMEREPGACGSLSWEVHVGVHGPMMDPGATTLHSEAPRQQAIEAT